MLGLGGRGMQGSGFEVKTRIERLPGAARTFDKQHSTPSLTLADLDHQCFDSIGTASRHCGASRGFFLSSFDVRLTIPKAKLNMSLTGHLSDRIRKSLS